MSIRQDLYDWFRGEDKTFEFVVFKNDLRTKQDVTGWTFKWTVRTTIDAAGTTLNYTTGAGVTTVDATNGVVDVVVPRADTTGLTAPFTYVYSLARTDAGNFTELAYGDAPLNLVAAQ